MVNVQNLRNVINRHANIYDEFAHVKNLDVFAEACVNGNSIRELIEALNRGDADKTDCAAWGIKPAQWRNSIEAALASLILVDCGDRIPTDEQLSNYLLGNCCSN